MIQMTTRNATLADLGELLKVQQAAKVDVVAPATSIRSREGVWIIDGGGEPVPDPVQGVKTGPGAFLPTAMADEGMAEKLGIPTGYLRRLREKRVDLYDANVNGWLHGSEDYPLLYPNDDRNFLVRCFRDADGDGIARALLSDGFGFIDHLDTLTAVLEGVRSSGAETQVVGCDLSERRMYLKIAAPGVAALAPILLGGYRSPFDDPAVEAQRRHEDRQIQQIRRLAAEEGKGYAPGSEPIVFAGFVASNSETGDGACSIVPVLTAEICMNGYRVTRDLMRRVHLGSRLEEGVVQWSADTQRKNLDLVVAQARDAVATFLSPEYVQTTVAWLEEKAGAPVAKPAETVQIVGKQLGFSPERTDAILDHFIRGGQMTAGGVMNAVTSYAQVIPNPDDANEVEGLGIKAMELAAAVR